jgi:hypothetical protein
VVHRLASRIDEAQRLQATDPAAANSAWIEIEHQLVEDAIWVPLTTPCLRTPSRPAQRTSRSTLSGGSCLVASGSSSRPSARSAEAAERRPLLSSVGHEAPILSGLWIRPRKGTPVRAPHPAPQVHEGRCSAKQTACTTFGPRPSYRITWRTASSPQTDGLPPSR